MEFNKETLEKVLNVELVGKDVGYSSWNFVSTVLKIIRICAKKVNLNENDFSYELKRDSNNSVYLTYKGVCFGEAGFQKQKGEYQRGGGYEWTFKKVFIRLYNEADSDCPRYKSLTFLEMIAEIESDLQLGKDLEVKKLMKAKEIFQKIKKELDTDNDFEVVHFIEYMNKNKYSLY